MKACPSRICDFRTFDASISPFYPNFLALVDGTIIQITNSLSFWKTDSFYVAHPLLSLFAFLNVKSILLKIKLLSLSFG